MLEQISPSKRFISYVFAFVIIVFGIFFALSSGMHNVKNKKYVVYFDRSITGLKVGSMVSYKGVEVGFISDIELELVNSDSRVKVIIDVKRSLPIYEGCIAKIASQSLVSGSGFLDLCNKKNAQQLLKGYMPEITSEYSLTEKVMEQLPEIVLNTNNTMNILNDLFIKNRKNINSSIKVFEKNMKLLTEILNNLNNSALTINSTLIPSISNSVNDISEVSSLIKRDYSIFTDDGMVSLIDLINNLNNLSKVLNEAVKPESKSYLRTLIKG